MIVQEDELEYYLGNSLEDLLGRVHARTLKKVRSYAHPAGRSMLSVIDYLFLAHHIGNASIRGMAKEIGIGHGTLINIFELCNLPRLTPDEAIARNFKNPEFMKTLGEAQHRYKPLELEQLLSNVDAGTPLDEIAAKLRSQREALYINCSSFLEMTQTDGIREK